MSIDYLGILRQIVSEMDIILDEHKYNEDECLNDTGYAVLKAASDNISSAVQTVENMKYINNSFLFLDENHSEDIEDYIDKKLVIKAIDLVDTIKSKK